MKKRMTLRELRELIHEEMSDPSLDGNDSVDSQIDRFLVEYESEAKHAKTEGRDFRSMVRRLLEVDDKEEDAGDKPADDAPTKASLDDIDMDSFVESVARLIQNYENLLEVKNTILRRAGKFLEKTYDDEVLAKFSAGVRENYGMEIGKSRNDIEQDDFQPPAARGAGPDGP